MNRVIIGELRYYQPAALVRLVVDDIGMQILLYGLIMPLSLPVSLQVVRGILSVLDPEVVALR